MPAQVIRGRGRRFLLFEEWKAYCRLGAPAAHACCSLPRASHPATRQPAQTTSIEKHSPACSARHCTLATHSLTCLTPSAHLTRPLPPSAVRADRGIAVADAHPRALHHRGGAARRLPAAAGLRARALAVLRVLPLTRPDIVMGSLGHLPGRLCSCRRAQRRRSSSPSCSGSTAGGSAAA